MPRRERDQTQSRLEQNPVTNRRSSRMNIYTTSVLSILAACVLGVAAAAPAASDQKRPSKEQVILARLMAAIKYLAIEADDLEAFVEKATSSLDLSGVEKRQAWEMDYGWGGGRFGKRGDSQKRYDAYGIAGRFGRDVDHVDSDSH